MIHESKVIILCVLFCLFSFFTVRDTDFIFSMHTPLMMPIELTLTLMLKVTKHFSSPAHSTCLENYSHSPAAVSVDKNFNFTFHIC